MLHTYKFLLTALDADLNKSDDFIVDRFRLKIWSEVEAGSEQVVYDNGATDDDEGAPQAITGG